MTPAHRGAYDVAIAGGPAGLAAAIACAAGGLRVALFESDPFPRRRPGETQHPGIEPVIERLGAARQVPRSGLSPPRRLLDRGVSLGAHVRAPRLRLPNWAV